jgi:hypothetical protein
MSDRVVMEPATPADEPELRRLLRDAPFAGAVSLSLEREPDFHQAASIEGDRHFVVAARAPGAGPGGPLVGLGTRSVRTALVNGRRARLGYLGQLRALGDGRGNVRAIRDGWALFRADRRPEELGFDLTSVVSDNAPARRLLERGLPGFPRYRPLGELVTLAFVPRRRRPRAPAVRAGAASDLPAIAALLAAEGRRRQFASCPTADDLASPERARGLAPGDFLLVERDGRLVGCAALWDQRPFRQVVVRGYGSLLAAARPILSLVGRPLGIPRLPPVGATLAAAFLAFLAVEADDGEVFAALLDHALARGAARGLDQLLLGLAADHPLLPVAAARPHRRYRSTLYAVHFEEGAPDAGALDGRTLGPEVATL